jgi:hypothetical protein
MTIAAPQKTASIHMNASVRPLFGVDRTFERPRKALVDRLWLAVFGRMR